ncbi:lactate racemase domain-containing protein [Tuwongella immobilis]|uniref:LarA-like N-terminal domain-containing protein n=1 Tax=Tuwongella immobilis TaxID=692036 RepID=A0A6C2YLX8_9BACT|nr:lactate racemase domain-containing protein [Tuwongella immobilis]VIP02588.1 Transcriptional regulator OS=Planctomyces maris DSM 8797 GN=PM8797T_13650 PE=4 SV=1: DUF2088 [Tuwongella immobilis]VTS01852.1 Transcriptional regulator OS=Planctomyces maris DSM 8797 GN=PM8797T_13650 PE=4 SV=1: DUF2088 [Tuwongella immobilis]
MNDVELTVGRSRWTVSIPPEKRVPLHPEGTGNPIAPVRLLLQQALQQPIRFEPLRRILTPDDSIVIVFDERLPQCVTLLQGVVEELQSAGIAPGQITVLTAPGAQQAWLDDLPESLREIRRLVHAPEDRQQLAYLASTQAGRRLYWNSALVEADQILVLTSHRPDLVAGELSGTTALWPRFSDQATIDEWAARWERKSRNDYAHDLQEEALEAASLLGIPFMIEVIESSQDSIDSILAGLSEITPDVRSQHLQRWGNTIHQRASLVIATISGDPRRHDFDDICRALRAARKAVDPGGWLLLLTEIHPNFPESMQALRHADDPADAIRPLSKRKGLDRVPALDWALAANRARLALAVDLDPETLEDLAALHVADVRSVQRLIDSCDSVLVLPDAHQIRLRLSDAPTT